MTNKEKAIVDLIKIRRTDEFNLFTDSKKVLKHAEKEGMTDLLEYEKTKDDAYLELLNILKSEEYEETERCPVCGESITEIEKDKMKEDYPDLFNLLEQYGVESIIDLD